MPFLVFFAWWAAWFTPVDHGVRLLCRRRNRDGTIKKIFLTLLILLGCFSQGRAFFEAEYTVDDGRRTVVNSEPSFDAGKHMIVVRGNRFLDLVKTMDYWARQLCDAGLEINVESTQEGTNIMISPHNILRIRTRDPFLCNPYYIFVEPGWDNDYSREEIFKKLDL